MLTDFAENDSPDEKPRDIISRRLIETAQNVINKLRERGRKRKKKIGTKRGVKKRRLKKETYSPNRRLSLPDHVCGNCDFRV